MCIVFSDGIYENASVLKSANTKMLTPVTTTIEKYEFGQDNDVSDNENHDEDHEDDATEEDNTNAGGVSFQVRCFWKDAF